MRLAAWALAGAVLIGTALVWGLDDAVARAIASVSLLAEGIILGMALESHSRRRIILNRYRKAQP